MCYIRDIELLIDERITKGQALNCLHHAHPSLQTIPLPQRERVSLGNDWNYVDFAVDGLHELHIQGL